MSETRNTILVVEDQPDDVFLIQRAFQKANLSNPIQVVRGGEEAMAYLTGKAFYADRERYPLPELMFLDLKMPGMSGFEVLLWLRQQPGLRRLPVVVLTSSNESEDINRAYELGANSYMVKPVLFDDLLKRVETLNLYWFILSVRPQIPPSEAPPLKEQPGC